VDGKIYVIGGGSPSQLGLPTVEEYDPATDTWTRKADMPTPRHGLSTSVLDGKIYAISGFDGTNMTTVEAYDPASDTWTKKADLPTLRSHVATQVVNGKIYAIGGWDRIESIHTAFSSVAVYDPAADAWTMKADMPTARWSPASGVVNGKIYVVGGTVAPRAGEQQNLTTVEIYDPETDTWVQGVDMPTARGWVAASLIDGKLYAVGGRLNSASGSVEVFPTVEEFVSLGN
jgi:N-acetylneuraminic acid mutarotase